MKIAGTNYEIIWRNGKRWVNFGSSTTLHEASKGEKIAVATIDSAVKKGCSEAEIKNIAEQAIAAVMSFQSAQQVVQQVTETDPATTTAEKKPVMKMMYTNEQKTAIIQLNQSMIDFFKEFEFDVSDRFMDTLMRIDSHDAIRQYVEDYFALTYNVNLSAVIEKMKATEFEDILNRCDQIKSVWCQVVKQPVNKRFEVFYGPAGTGKTTEAIRIARSIYPDVEVIACTKGDHAEDYTKQLTFVDGNPTWAPAPLVTCAEEGRPIVVDEIANAPIPVLESLQNWLDNKDSLTINGIKVHIKEGFKIIGTMNLYVNGVVHPLPCPLVDRAFAIHKYVSSGETIFSHLFGEQYQEVIE